MWTPIIWWGLGPKPFQLDFQSDTTHFNGSPPRKASKAGNPITYRLPQGFHRKRNQLFNTCSCFTYLLILLFSSKKLPDPTSLAQEKHFSHNSSLLFKIILENSTFISVHYFIFSFPISDRKMLWLSIHASVFDVWFFPLFNTIICVNLFLFQNFDCRIATFTTFLPSEWIEQNISG